MAADRVNYLPMDLVSMVPFRFDGLPDDKFSELMNLLAEAYGRGYHDGYVRGMCEESARQHLKDKRTKAALGLSSVDEGNTDQ